MIGSHINLQVFVTQFDFLSGKLDLEMKSYPIGNEKTEHSQPPRFVDKYIFNSSISLINNILCTDWK